MYVGDNMKNEAYMNLTDKLELSIAEADVKDGQARKRRVWDRVNKRAARAQRREMA
jgi:hypothetical protein